MPRPRRKSSSLGADIRGDTSAPAMSTMNLVSPVDSEPGAFDKVWDLLICMFSLFGQLLTILANSPAACFP